MTKSIAQNHRAAARAPDHDALWVHVVSHPGRTMTLADPEMKDSVHRLEKAVTKSQTDALAFLRRAGIVTPTGRLTKAYGG